MSNNIFKQDISNNITIKNDLYTFLDIYCILENNNYIFNKELYKKYEFADKITYFINIVKNYYKSGKKYFVEREINYNNLLTIIRHICKYLKIEYTKKIIYNKNKYSIIYYIPII